MEVGLSSNTDVNEGNGLGRQCAKPKSEFSDGMKVVVGPLGYSRRMRSVVAHSELPKRERSGSAVGP